LIKYVIEQHDLRRPMAMVIFSPEVASFDIGEISREKREDY